MDKLHRSRVDNVLMMLILVAAVFSLLFSTLLALRGFALLALLLFLFTAVLPMWVVVSTRYHILGDELQICAGPFRWRIGLVQIRKVEPCHGLQPAPAMSAQRLRLTYEIAGKGVYSLVISPEDRYQFIMDIGVAEPEVE